MTIEINDSFKKIVKPVHVYEIVKTFLSTQDDIDKDKEHFFVIHLDPRMSIKVVEIISIGTVDQTLVHPREVFTRAVYLRSSSLVIAHNHPTGDPQPSAKDLSTTNKIKEAGDILGIEVIDHVIVGDEGYFSMKSEKMMA